MTNLPLAVHTAAQVRAIDQHAVTSLSISVGELMARAGEAAFSVLRSCWPATQTVVVVCGSGNNAGDGYVVARLALAARLRVRAVALTEVSRLRDDALRAAQDFSNAGGDIGQWSEGCLDGAEVIVDAVFGTGLSRDVDAVTALCINAINASGAAVLALDIPSGLHADTGRIMGSAVHADRTIAFVGLKLGFYLGHGPDCAGVVMFDGLDLPAHTLSHVGATALRISEHALGRLLPQRRRTTHKGQQGHVLVVGGGPGMAGAARLAGEAALRVGAGLVVVATRPENVASINAGRPELICRGIESPDELLPLLERADVLAIGPGLGTDPWAMRLVEATIGYGKPAVVDADALNLIARTQRSSDNWILTPHPGEASRLLGVSTADIQRDRLTSARSIAARYGGVVVLKGAGTLVVCRDELPRICDQGNPGMASPGMGDVLTGVIAGIAAQTADLSGAASAGVLVHAMAGDMAARRGERGLLATDLFTYLPTCVNPNQRL